MATPENLQFQKRKLPFQVDRQKRILRAEGFEYIEDETARIRFPYQKNLLMNTRNFYLKFDVRFLADLNDNGTEDDFVWLTNQAQACIRTLRILNKGEVIEEIDNYGLLSNLLMRVIGKPESSTSSNSILIGTEDATTVAWLGVPQAPREFMLNGRFFDSDTFDITLCVPLIGCFFRNLNTEYLPMHFRDLSLEVVWENPEDCWEHDKTKVIYSNVEFHGEFIKLPKDMPSPESFALSASSYVNKSLANIRPYSNIYEAEIPVRCKSAKKCLIAITASMYDYARISYIDQDIVFNGRRKADPVSLNFSRYNFTHPMHSFGTTYSPQETYLDLLNAFNLDLTSKTHITGYGWASKGLPGDNPFNDFFFAQKLELTPNLVSGTPLNSDLHFRIEYPDDMIIYIHPTTGDNLNQHFLVNSFVHYDMLVEVDAAGKTYVDY